VEAFQELETFTTEVNNLHITHDQPDARTFVWGNGNYTASKFYKFIFKGLPVIPALHSIWKSRALPKLKVFDWLLFMDRLNSKDLMNRKQWQIQGGMNCLLCNDGLPKTRDHLFFECPFAAECWSCLHIDWDMSV
jgi:hypothetical protein